VHKEAKKTKLETREKEKGPDLQFDFLQVDIMKIKEQSTEKVMTNSQKFYRTAK
jgi:hypothetical protein